MKRKEAISLGLKTYNTGKSCKYGHSVDRITSTGMCHLCEKERGKRNYRKDPEKGRLRSALWRKKNKEKTSIAAKCGDALTQGTAQ